MPRLSPEMYDAQNQTVLNLASRPGIGVSRNEIMDAIDCSRPRAEKLVKTLNLVLIREDGRTDYFGPPGATPMPVADTSVIEVLPSEPVSPAPMAAVATAVAPAPVAVAKPVVKSVNPEVTLLESRVRKLSSDLEIARTKLTVALMRS